MIIYSQKYYNKYHQIVKYYKDLDLRKSKDFYTEDHHIIPVCIGGLDEKDNLVRVPARVHFILHWMLCKIYKIDKFIYAWNMMNASSSKQNRYNSKSYQYARSAFSKERKTKSSWNKGKVLSQTHRSNISKSNIGKVMSIDTKKKISKSKTGQCHSKESKDKISLSCKGKNLGKPVSNETKVKLSIANSGYIHKQEAKDKIKNWANSLPAVQCPHCNKIGKGGAMKQHHFNNCKLILKI